MLDASADRVAEAGRRAVTFRVFPTNYRESKIVSPQSPSAVDMPVRVSYVGDSKFLATIDRSGGDAYAVTALVRERGDDKDGALTINRLRAAGTAYPPEIRKQYLGVPDDAIPKGGDAEKLLDAILAEVDDPDNPYDVASTMVDYLQSPAKFKYDADVRDLACEGLSVVECFARFQKGYCQYYASTMAILLREHGIPTRLAAGFLPGDREGLVERVSVSAAHAWVEVYFPGYGWVEFDPTGGGLANPEALPTGEPVASRAPTGSLAPVLPPGIGQGELENEFPITGGGNPLGTGPGASAALIVVAILLFVIVGALAFVVYRRGPRGEVTPDKTYAMLTRLAGRLGFGPRPTQTVYEYAVALGEVLPQSRPEIQTVAQAKVEFAYGRRMLAEDRLAALHEAHRRLRVGLLRLMFRKTPRRPRRR